jgi:hypothetical protein
VLEDVTVIDKLAQLGERICSTTAVELQVPLRHWGMVTVLAVVDLIRDVRIGNGHAQREVVLDDVARAGPDLLDEP